MPRSTTHQASSPWQAISPLESLDEGAHVAVLYASRSERDAHLIPYLIAATRGGKSGVCVAGDEPGSLERKLEAAVPGSSESLEVLPTDSTYLVDGEFAGDAMADWLRSVAEAAPRGSSGAVSHIAGDLDWLAPLDGSSLDDVHGYESVLDSFASQSRHTFACFYDTTSLPGAHLIDVFRTHSRVLVGGALWESPFYLTPDQASGASHVGALSADSISAGLT